VWWRNYDIMLSRFHRTPERDRQTDRQTDGQTELLYQYCMSDCQYMLTRDKNRAFRSASAKHHRRCIPMRNCRELLITLIAELCLPQLTVWPTVTFAWRRRPQHCDNFTDYRYQLSSIPIQVALLLQRGRAMLRVCQLASIVQSSAIFCY